MFVDEVYTERVAGQLHQTVHGHINVRVARGFTGPKSQTIVHQTARIPATHTHTHTHTHGNNDLQQTQQFFDVSLHLQFSVETVTSCRGSLTLSANAGK